VLGACNPVGNHSNKSFLAKVSFRKQLELTVQPDGLQIRLNCARATFYAYALPFNVVPNILRILTVFFHTEEGLYTRNACVNRQF